VIDAIRDPRERHGWGGLPCWLDEHDQLPMVRAHAGMTVENDHACLAILTGLGYHRPADNDPSFGPADPFGGRAA
jgi:hypothetical protein